MKDVKFKPVLFTSKTYAEGGHPILIRITNNRKVQYEGIGYAIPFEAWNPLEGKVFESRIKISEKTLLRFPPEKRNEIKQIFANAKVLHNAKSINADIVNKMAEISQALNKMKANDESISVQSIKKKISPVAAKGREKSLLVFGDEMTENYLSSGNIRTYKRYKMILKRLSGYIKTKDLSFKDLDFQFLVQYEIYLKKEGLQTNSIHNHLKTIRAIYYQAIKQEFTLAEKNPFFSFKLKLDKNNIKKEKLSLDEINKIIALDLKKGSALWHTRNYFLFSFYNAGIRIGDLIQLKWKYIKGERVEYKMDKTGTFKSLLLLPKAQKILSHYQNKEVKPDDYIFGLLDNNACAG
jgi:site-specific recombinase XerC